MCGCGNNSITWIVVIIVVLYVLGVFGGNHGGCGCDNVFPNDNGCGCGCR